jgi:hypothetical protein
VPTVRTGGVAERRAPAPELSFIDQPHGRARAGDSAVLVRHTNRHQVTSTG